MEGSSMYGAEFSNSSHTSNFNWSPEEGMDQFRSGVSQEPSVDEQTWASDSQEMDIGDLLVVFRELLEMQELKLCVSFLDFLERSSVGAMPFMNKTTFSFLISDFVTPQFHQPDQAGLFRLAMISQNGPVSRTSYHQAESPTKRGSKRLSDALGNSFSTSSQGLAGLVGQRPGPTEMTAADKGLGNMPQGPLDAPSNSTSLRAIGNLLPNPEKLLDTTASQERKRSVQESQRSIQASQRSAHASQRSVLATPQGADSERKTSERKTLDQGTNSLNSVCEDRQLDQMAEPHVNKQRKTLDHVASSERSPSITQSSGLKGLDQRKSELKGSLDSMPKSRPSANQNRSLDGSIQLTPSPTASASHVPRFSESHSLTASGISRGSVRPSGNSGGPGSASMTKVKTTKASEDDSDDDSNLPSEVSTEDEDKEKGKAVSKGDGKLAFAITLPNGKKPAAFGNSNFEDMREEDAATLADPTGRWICHPNSAYRMMWDLLSLLLIILECITVPLSAAFDLQPPEFWFVLTTVFFSLDIVINFCTGYFADGILIMRQSLIIKHYLQTYFLIDFFSTIPWESMAKGESQRSTSLIKVAKLGKMMRMFRLLRLVKLYELFTKLEDLFTSYTLMVGLSLFKMLGFFGFLCHWSACIWGFMGNPSKIGHHTKDLEPLPFEICDPGGPCEPSVVGSPWLRRYGLDKLPTSMQYLTSLHFATGLVTGNAIEITPGYWMERVYVLTMMIISFLVCSTIMSQIVVIIHKLNQNSTEFRERMRVIKEFMISRSVPMTLQAKVKRYLEYQFKSRKVTNDNLDFMHRLSPWLRLEVAEHLNKSVIIRHPFFQDLPLKVLKRVCMCAVTVLFAPGDVVVQKGHIATCMFFIVRGTLRILQAKTDEIKRNPRSVYLDAPSWIGDMCLFKEVVRTHTVMSTTHAELLTIQKEKLLGVIAEFPKSRKNYDEFQQKVIKGDLIGAGILCQYCKHSGHSAADCPDLQKDLERSANQRQTRQTTKKSMMGSRNGQSTFGGKLQSIFGPSATGGNSRTTRSGRLGGTGSSSTFGSKGLKKGSKLAPMGATPSGGDVQGQRRGPAVLHLAESGAASDDFTNMNVNHNRSESPPGDDDDSDDSDQPNGNAPS